MNKMIVILGFVLVGAQAMAAECPATFGNEDYLDKAVAAIEASKSCEEGAQIAEACALGASGDAYMVPVATEKCEKDFAGKLKKSDRKTYLGLNKKCDKKYENMEGSMYISFNVFCHLKVARLYLELFTPAE